MFVVEIELGLKKIQENKKLDDLIKNSGWSDDPIDLVKNLITTY
jgi:hypothetical protein